MQQQSAYISQATLFGYLKTRIGSRYVSHFNDEKFLASVNMAKVEIYLAALEDFALYVTSYMSTDRSIYIKGSMEDMFLNMISEDENLKLNNDRKIKAREHFKIRLNSIDMEKFYLNEPFKNSSEALYRFAPIADELKIQDRDIILNSMILKWKHVTDDLKKNSKNFSL
jgi:predicted nuclease with TOPRIM domain